MFGLSLPPVVCRRVHVFMSYLRYLCLLVHSGVQRILCCVFVLFFFVLCLVHPILPVFLDFPYLIAHSAFYNVYLL